MKIIISLLAFFSILTASASDASSGCGPGWYILKENSIVSSSLRATTNGIFFPTTTIGMTIGTSNCTKHKIVLNEKKSLHFVTHNYYELKSEAVKGNGDYLMALNEVLGCNPKDVAHFSKKIKKSYKTIFNSKKPETVLFNIYNTILRDESLVKSCSLS
jgi:hypothetical protein